MSRIHVEAERVVGAKPEAVYGAISDYKEQRPKILTPNFLNYKVEKGGRGSGTVVSYRLHAARRERPYQIRVEEPLKGVVLTERDTNSSLVTTWTLTPMKEGQQTRVRVASEWQGGSGVGGFFERTFAPLGLHRIYNNMLSLLASSLSTSVDEQSSSAAVLSNEDKASAGPNLGLFFLVFGLAVAIALGIWYIQKSRRDNA